MKVTYDDGVLEELVSLSSYLAEVDEEVAYRFLDACEAAFLFLVKNPRIGSPKTFQDPALKDIRMWRVKGFGNYLIFYQSTASSVRILHVIHSAIDYNRVFDDEVS